MLIKIGKTTPGVQKHSTVMNKWGSLDSLVANTPGWGYDAAYGGFLPSLQWTVSSKMGCHLVWYFAVGCPLKGGRGEYKQ